MESATIDVVNDATSDAPAIAVSDTAAPPSNERLEPQNQNQHQDQVQKPEPETQKLAEAQPEQQQQPAEQQQPQQPPKSEVEQSSQAKPTTPANPAPQRRQITPRDRFYHQSLGVSLNSNVKQVSQDEIYNCVGCGQRLGPGDRNIDRRSWFFLKEIRC